MKNLRIGFTLVELMIVIAVIGILVTVGTMAWTGVLADSRDETREAEVNQWISTFNTYKGKYAVWPLNPSPGTNATVCLGSFSSYSNKCGQFNSSTSGRFIAASGTNFNTILSEVDKVGNVPVNSDDTDITGTLVGPLVYITHSANPAPYTVTGRFFNFFESGCPTGWTEYYASPGSPALPGPISGVLNGIDAHACAKTESFTYSPS